MIKMALRYRHMHSTPTAADPNGSYTERSTPSGNKNLSTSSPRASKTMPKDPQTPMSPQTTSRVALDTLPSPYLIGFNHSRLNDPPTFTRDHPTVSHDYQHHRYAENRMQRFCLGYDYCRVGLLLLEIGLWEPLSDSRLLERDIKDVQLVIQQDLWLSQAVPQLGPLVGRIYQEAVRVCLSDELPDVSDEEAKNGFETRVVDELLRCCA